MPNPTSIVASNLVLNVSDVLTGAQLVSHVMPVVNFKAAIVQYQGYVNIPAGNAFIFAPIPSGVILAVAFVRNLGGQGSGNVTVQTNPTAGVGGYQNAVNLDVGGFFLYISPLLSSIAVSTIQPGLTSIQIISAPSTSGNLEVLIAG